MDKNLELELVKKYPKILKDYGGDKRETCMHWGIDCGNGWYKLLDKLMAKLQLISDFTGIQVIANQIKEKFGTLCFYYSLDHSDNSVNKDHIVSDIISNIVSAAERKSSRTCEVTGEHGEMCVKGFWYKVLSREQAKKDGYIPTGPTAESIKAYWKECEEKGIEN